MPATVVPVHGAWRGAWCWDRVVERLAALMLDAGKWVNRSVAEPTGGAPGPESEIGSAMHFSHDDAIALLGPQPTITFQQSASAAAWREVPSMDVVCAEDRAIPVWIQRTRAGLATT
jgi:hypothetical protein